MAEIVIENIDGVSGRYELDIGRFTNAELRMIKRESGVRAGEFEEAIRAGDNDVLVCWAIIALQRSGRSVVQELLWEADAGNISIEFEEEAESGPPESAPDSAESESGPTESS